MKIESITNRQIMSDDLVKELEKIPYVVADSFAFAAHPQDGIIGIQFNMRDDKGVMVKFAMAPGVFLDWANLVAAHLVKMNQEFAAKKPILQ